MKMNRKTPAGSMKDLNNKSDLASQISEKMLDNIIDMLDEA